MNARRHRFVREYLEDGNGTQAAIRAGYASPSANRIASRLLSNDDIRNAVLDGQQRAQEIAEIDAAWVLRRLAMLVNVRIEDLFSTTRGTSGRRTRCPKGRSI